MERPSAGTANILLAGEEAAAAKAPLADPTVAAWRSGEGAAKKLLLWTEAAGAASNTGAGPELNGAARVPPAAAEAAMLAAKPAAAPMG